MGGAILPRWTGERPSCAVVIDTSSSVTAFDLEMARAAGHYIGRVADARYYSCDTRATSYGATMPDRLAGGGGTNLVRGIEMAIADGAKAVVVITDCMTPWPDEPTAVPIIVGANPGATKYVLGPDATALSRQLHSARMDDGPIPADHQRTN
jgi:predicted metal-dependent peptidase